MKNSFISFWILFSLSMANPTWAVPAKKKESKKSLPAKIVNQEPQKPLMARTKLNAQFGFNTVSGSAVVSGFQLGRLIYSKFPIYMGPELSFMVFSPGSVLNVLWGSWVESRVFRDPKKSLDFGLFLGPGFSNQRPGWKTTNAVLLLDISYSQEMEDFLTLRGQLRPGVFDGKVLGMMIFSAQFRIP
ncbi:MAG: hypothetical protein ACKOA8_19370 [Deltaproteobacteria bacterium]